MAPPLSDVPIAWTNDPEGAHRDLRLRATLIAVLAGLSIGVALPLFVPLVDAPLAYLAIALNVVGLLNAIWTLRLAVNLGRVRMQADVAAAGLRRSALLLLVDVPAPILAFFVAARGVHFGDAGPRAEGVALFAGFVGALLLSPVWGGVRIFFLLRLASGLEREPLRAAVERAS